MSARIVPARHGLLWLLAGFALLRREPRQLILLSIGYYLLLVIFLKWLQIIGTFVLPLALPAISALLANGVRSIEHGQRITPDKLKEGLAVVRQPLLRLGGIQLLGTLLLIALGIALGNEVRFDDGLSAEEVQELIEDLSILLLAATPLLMAFWFAPLLVLWQKMPAGKALFFSLVASWRNWRAFLVYGLLVVLIGAVVPGLLLVAASMVSKPLFAVLTMLLRLALIFGLAPVLVCGTYVSWRDIFIPEPLEAEPGNA